MNKNKNMKKSSKKVAILDKYIKRIIIDFSQNQTITLMSI